ncbi:hypothetical protein [Propionivibrio sp.]|uniref:hypothetical protein n=1 Tax=Propionivibrio sp. TaxID=2212460 RepID=UPI0039E409AA
MNPFEADIIRVTDPLTPYTRSVRKSLLISSVIAMAVAKTGFVPTKISALGLEFSQADRGAMLWLVGAVVAFFLISFLVSAFGDFMAWRMSQMAKAWDEDSVGYENLRKLFLEDKKLTEEEREELREQERRVGAMWRNAGHLDNHLLIQRLVGPISWARVTVEFILPFLAGIAGLVLIVRTTP